MNRRDLLQRSAMLIGGTILGADSLLAKNIDWDAMEQDDIGAKGIGIFSKSQIRFLNEIADTIIPNTDTPGAKAAKVGQFIAVMVSDCYDSEYQQRFMAGLESLNDSCKGRHGKSYMRCSKSLRHDHLVEMDAEQKAYYKSRKSGMPDHYFKVIKDLVLWGYFSSEIGATKALRFVEYPGRYETIDYKKGDRLFGGY